MPYSSSSESGSETTESSELSFLKSSSDENLPAELQERNRSGKYPKKKWLTPEQQSRLLVKRDLLGLFPDKEKTTLQFKRERRNKTHYELDGDPNRGGPVSAFVLEKANPYFERKWERTATELQITIVGDKKRGYVIRKRGKEAKWRPDHELLTPPTVVPSSHSIYEDGYMNPDVHIPLRIEKGAEPSGKNIYIPLLPPRIHALEGGIVHMFDSRTLKTYRLFDRQEFELIASLRFDEMHPEEQLTSISFVPTRHSIALGFADGNAAICRIEVDHSTQTGRARHNFEYVMAPAEANLVITKIEQHPCTQRLVALCYYDAPRMNYVVRVIDHDRVLDKENTIFPAGNKEKEFFSQYPENEKFGARQGPFRTVDGKEAIPMKEARQHARVLSVRIVERVTDLMWFNDRRSLMMIFTERTMRLIDISKEEKEKVIKSCTLSRPLTSPTVHPGIPSLFSALDRHRVVLFDRRCLKSPISIIDVPSAALSRGIPRFASWCPSDMNKLFVHYHLAQRVAVIQYNRYPDCSKLTDGGCDDDEVSPVFKRLPQADEEMSTFEFRWPYNVNDEFPVSITDHFVAEVDLEGGLMEAVPYPKEWKDTEEPLVWRPEFEVNPLSFSGHSYRIRRIQSNPDITTADEKGNFVHPFKRFVKVARDRRDDSVFNDCVEWKIWEQMHSMKKPRSKSEERPIKGAPKRYRYAEEEDLCRPIPVSSVSAYPPNFEKSEVVYPVFTSEFVDMPVLETILKMKRPSTRKIKYCKNRISLKVPFKHENINYENSKIRHPPGPVISFVRREKRLDSPLNQTRRPTCVGGLYYGVQGRPLRHMRSSLDHSKFYNDDSSDDISNTKKKRLMEERRRDELMRMLMDEEDDMMSARDCRWLKMHRLTKGKCVPSEPKYDPFVQRLRKTRIHDSDDSEIDSTVDPNDDCLRRVNEIRQINKHDFPFIEDRSLFDVNGVGKHSTATSSWNTHLIELPVQGPLSFCLFAFSMELIVQGSTSDVKETPNSVIIKIVIEEEPIQTQPKLCYPQVADMSAYLRSILGVNSLQSVKLVKKSGFGEFMGSDISKGYIDTLKHLRQHLEDSDGNRFALDYIERLFNDNHVADHDRGYPNRFEVPNPVYSDTTDEDDPKKKKKKIVFASHDDRPKMEQLKEKLYKKKRAKFLKRRRACEELKLNYDAIFPQPEVQKQMSLCELFDKGDPKRSIVQDPVPAAIYEQYSGSSDSNEEANYLPQVTVRQPLKKEYDFEEEEQIIERETKEIEIIQKYRKQGRIPPFEFHYDEDGNMFPPKSATLEQEYNLNTQTTRTLLRRMVERDARVHELKRRKEILLDRLPEEVAEDTYDEMMSDLKVLFDEMEDYECYLSMAGDFFEDRRQQRRRKVYGQGWRRNRKLQHEFLNKSLDLCDQICKIRFQADNAAQEEKVNRRLLKAAQREAKKLLREIRRRDVSGDYSRVLRQYQFRRHFQQRDFNMVDFLNAFEEITLKMCGRQFSSHHHMIRSMTHLRKIRYVQLDSDCEEEEKPCFTDGSDSDFKENDVSSVSAESSSALSGQPLFDPERKKKLVKRKKKISEKAVASESEDEEDYKKVLPSTVDAEPAAHCEIMENHPACLLPTREILFYEDDAEDVPVSTLARNPVDAFKQLPIFRNKDLKPPRGPIVRPKKIKNRKQRNKRDRRNWIAAQEKQKKERILQEKKSMNGIIELMSRIFINTRVEQDTEWRRRREKKLKDRMRHSSNGGRSNPHRSITRKLLDSLRIGGGPRSFRVYTNGSIYPPPRIPHWKVFDKFDLHTNPFARVPAPDPEKRRPQATFLDDGNIELGIAVDQSNENGLFPPDEFGFPLRFGERIPNNVEWVFPKYYEGLITRREKQKRKRKKRFLSRGQDQVSKFFNRKGAKKGCVEREDGTFSSASTCSTRMGSSLHDLPELTADEIFMSKYVCISNPGLVRSVSFIELSTRDQNDDINLRPRSCLGRLTEEMEPLEAVEAEFAGSQELPPPPGLIIDEHGRHVWHTIYRTTEEPRQRPRNHYEDFSDTRPMSFLLSPLHSSSDSDDDYDDDITPVPPLDDDKTPTEFSLSALSQQQHTNTPETEVLSEIVKERMNSGDSISSRERIDSPRTKKESPAILSSSEYRELKQKRKRRSRGVEPRDFEEEKRVGERFDHLMEKLFFEELGVVPEQLRGGFSPEPVDMPESFPAAWLTLNKSRKFKRIIKRNHLHSLISVPELEKEEYSRKNMKAIKELVLALKSSARPKQEEDRILERVARIRPGTPYVDINSVEADASELQDYESEEGENHYDYFVSQNDSEATDIEDDLEDEQYRDDQDDAEIMECFKSESDEDPLGDSPSIDSAQEEREESIEIDAIDAATTVSEAPTLTAFQSNSLPNELMFEGASEADDVSSDDEADEEVMNVFGRNLVHPDFPDRIVPPVVVAPPSAPIPLLEEKPVSSVEISDEDPDDEITVAEEAFDSLQDPKPTKPVPIVIPPAIPRPERLLDLMPSNLIFEGVDYWGLTEAQMEEALDEVITERERIREELLRPPPKERHVYRLVHEENQSGSLKEIVELEFSSSDSESHDHSLSKSFSPEKSFVEPIYKRDPNTNIIYTAGELEVAPPTPPPKRNVPYIACRDRRKIEDKFRRWRNQHIGVAIEDDAWERLLNYVKSEFHHNSYGRKPVVHIPDLNLVRGIPRYILKIYIDQMRVRRYEENDLIDQLEEQNHLFFLKGVEKIPEKRKSKPEPAESRELAISFAEPVAVIPTRIYHPIRHAPRKRSILKIRSPTPDLVQAVEPVVEVPVKRHPSHVFVFKKTVKDIEPPHPEDTRYPTEQDYNTENAEKLRLEAKEHLLRPGTLTHKTDFIYKCRGVPGIIHISMNEQIVKKEFLKDSALLGGFYFMRSKERLAVLQGIGFCDYKTDQIADLLETRRLNHENPFAIALMALMMGQGTYTVNFLTRVLSDGWYSHRLEDSRARDEADAVLRYCLLFCEWRSESQRLPQFKRDALRRNLLDKYLKYKQLEDACIFTRCIMAFLLTLAYSETRHFVDDVVYCKQVPMMFRVAFTTLFCERTRDWQQTLLELLKELPPHDIQRFAFIGVGRHPDCINAILEFAKHTSDVQFASFLLIVGECFDVQPFVKSNTYYEHQCIRTLDPRREVFKYWFALNNEMESVEDDDDDDDEISLDIYSEMVDTQSALLGYTLKHEIINAMKEKARPPMEQIFPVALLYRQTNMRILEEQAYEVMRHYAYVLQLTHNWIAAAQIFYLMGKSEALGAQSRFETEVEIACSFCCTTLSYGRTKARIIKKEEKKKLEDARERHMEAQRKRMEQGLAPQPFTGAPKKGPVKDIPDDVDTKIRAIACLACRKPLPRCAICFNHMFNPVANEEGCRGEQVGFGFAACRRCHHGGHPDHLDVWFRENYRCPVAQCNCECDYDNYWDTLTLHESLDYKLLGAPQLTLGVHQGAPPASPPPAKTSDDDDEVEEINEVEQEDEVEKELEDAKRRFCYGRISVD